MNECESEEVYIEIDSNGARRANRVKGGTGMSDVGPIRLMTQRSHTSPPYYDPAKLEKDSTVSPSGYLIEGYAHLKRSIESHIDLMESRFGIQLKWRLSLTYADSLGAKRLLKATAIINRVDSLMDRPLLILEATDPKRDRLVETVFECLQERLGSQRKSRGDTPY